MDSRAGNGQKDNPPGPALQLVNRYLAANELREIRSRLGDQEYKGVTLEGSVLKSEDGLTRDALMAHMQGVLSDLRSSLVWLTLRNSNVTGRIFHRGIERVVQDPVKCHVSVESTQSDGEVVVRDDDPPMTHTDENGLEYYYSKSLYDEVAHQYSRFYVSLNWMPKVVQIDISNTNISGYGLSALAASCGRSLRSLQMRSCRFVDDKGMYSLVKLCSSLQILDLQGCAGVTAHGILYLANFAHDQVEKLQMVNLADCKVSNRVGVALFNALCYRGFQGLVMLPVKDAKSQAFITLDAKTQTSPVSKLYVDAPEDIFDMTGALVTQYVLHQVEVDVNIDRIAPRLALDFKNSLVDDFVLEKVLSRYGEKLYFLCLAGTYITEKGLSLLAMCPNLRQLNLARCWNIVHKSEANQSIMPAVQKMNNLRQLDISDTRLSGRMLSTNVQVKLTHLIAMRAPISVHAVRLLSEQCKDSLRVLSLAGCSFLNQNAIYFIAHFTRLEKLDLSNCTTLKKSSIELLKQRLPQFFRTLQEINVSGIPGMDRKSCDELSEFLTSQAPTNQVRVVGGGQSESKRSARFRGESPSTLCPYAPLPGVLGKSAQSIDDSSKLERDHPHLRRKREVHDGQQGYNAFTSNDFDCNRSSSSGGGHGLAQETNEGVSFLPTDPLQLYRKFTEEDVKPSASASTLFYHTTKSEPNLRSIGMDPTNASFYSKLEAWSVEQPSSESPTQSPTLGHLPRATFSAQLSTTATSASSSSSSSFSTTNYMRFRSNDLVRAHTMNSSAVEAASDLKSLQGHYRGHTMPVVMSHHSPTPYSSSSAAAAAPALAYAANNITLADCLEEQTTYDKGVGED